jgi:arginine N-succinyltransferase
VLILRPVAATDLADLTALAGQLDSVNLPSDAAFLENRIALSLRSFGRRVPDGEAIYVFVLEDTAAGRCIGTSTVVAKHGRPGSPFYWLEVSSEERRSPGLGKRFVHTRLRLRSSEDGPSEVGGLILEPGYRRHPLHCGKALSVVRFAWISMHPDRFQPDVVAEMLSPFVAPGRNLLWDAFGAHFTGLSYREADRLSGRDKQFIADLFPADPVYVTLFPKEVQESIGQPNESARAAVRILERIGFDPLNQVDPFDGGPYYGAARDAIVSVRERRELVLPGVPMQSSPAEDEVLALLSAEGRSGFRATVVPLDADGAPRVAAECREALGVAAGARVTVTPLP